MVTTALEACALTSLTNRMHLADHVQVYKPSRAIYDSLVQYANAGPGPSVARENIWLVSG